MTDKPPVADFPPNGKGHPGGSTRSRGRRRWIYAAAALAVAATAACVVWIALLYFPRVPLPHDRPPPLTLIDAVPSDFKSPKRIVLDPGHGGDKDGATSAYSRPEKEVNLEVALALGRHLEATGLYKVIFTRKKDVDVAIRDRRRFRCDAFISIHADWDGSGLARGMRLIWSYRQKRRDAAQWSPWLANYLGAALKERGFSMYGFGPELMDAGSPTGYYHYLATWPDYGVFVTDYRDLGVLGRNRFPAVLIETHFLTNKKDVRSFQIPESYERFCRGVEIGLLNFFAKKDGVWPVDAEKPRKGRWEIQVCAMAEQREAKRVLTFLEEKGFAGHVERSGRGKAMFYRVRVGPYGTEAEADAARRTLTAHSHPDHWKVFVPEK